MGLIISTMKELGYSACITNQNLADIMLSQSKTPFKEKKCDDDIKLILVDRFTIVVMKDEIMKGKELILVDDGIKGKTYDYHTFCHLMNCI